MSRGTRLKRLEQRHVRKLKVFAVTDDTEPGVVRVNGVRMSETAFREKYGYGDDILFIHVTHTRPDEDGKGAWWEEM